MKLHVLNTQTRNKYNYQSCVGSIIPLKSKLYYEKTIVILSSLLFSYFQLSGQVYEPVTVSAGTLY